MQQHAHAIHGGHHPQLAHHFESLEQQKEAAELGMWAFLLTEILFFGGLFLAYLIYRNLYPEAFLLASNQLDVTLGGTNTAILICSSLTMALAVRAGHTGAGRIQQIFWLAFTMLFGMAFLVIKYFEYKAKWDHGLMPGITFMDPHGHAAEIFGGEVRHARIFFSLYFAMTGLHAFHMIVGFGLMSWIAFRAWKGHFTPDNSNALEMSGLYWHFVDIVWIFLFPLLYLLGAHVGHGGGGHH